MQSEVILKCRLGAGNHLPGEGGRFLLLFLSVEFLAFSHSWEELLTPHDKCLGIFLEPNSGLKVPSLKFSVVLIKFFDEL